jgi:Bacterial transglutaminase-like N-terminal region
MKRIRIVHRTEYHYHQPVTFGPHRAMMRPREGHDVHIVRGRIDVEPAGTVRWLRDIYSNSIAVLTFSEPSRKPLGRAPITLLARARRAMARDPTRRVRRATTNATVATRTKGLPAERYCGSILARVRAFPRRAAEWSGDRPREIVSVPSPGTVDR